MMPKGVEHELKNLFSFMGGKVSSSVMPKGVEHSYRLHEFLYGFECRVQ